MTCTGVTGCRPSRCFLPCGDAGRPGAGAGVGRPGELSRLGEGWSRFASGDHRVTRLWLAGLSAGELVAMARELGVGDLSGRAVAQLLDHTGGTRCTAGPCSKSLAPVAWRGPGMIFLLPGSWPLWSCPAEGAVRAGSRAGYRGCRPGPELPAGCRRRAGRPGRSARRP